ncbi:protein rapunzel-like [Polypterus senegalus]|uniref:protein rapunzel-like n=1 Tax=Polypterus senegalus TaxID=55291 RepID=UPI001965BA06|nr:protein rapunzel-like [Polypterus senegalus]XP_039608864.1 protein rapunzel-like [Polypterus senegalus]XP_039608868.1 protein rapunzel-like [Polypterus senegalus]
MSHNLKKIVAEKKEAIETVMEMFEQGTEVLASAVGEIFPICEVASPILSLVLDNIESKEVQFVKAQYQVVRDKLDVISSEIESLNQEIKKARVDSTFFVVEENLRNQFRKYMDILNAKPQYKEVKKNLFLDHFSKSGGERNLHTLYDAVMGNNTFGESILSITLTYEEKNRRRLENFIVCLKELFCIGIICLLGHAAITGGEEEELINDWSKKMGEAESQMKLVLDECIDGFAEQAQLDVEKLVKEKDEMNYEELPKDILEFLMKKYDWIKWSVRVNKHSGSSFSNWRAGEKYHSVTGQHWFDLPQINNTNVMVSYSADPQPINKDCIRQLMEGQFRKEKALAVAENICEQLPGCVVHTVSRYKEIWALWSFPDECHYWEHHKNVTLCVHSE